MDREAKPAESSTARTAATPMWQPSQNAPCDLPPVPLGAGTNGAQAACVMSHWADDHSVAYSGITGREPLPYLAEIQHTLGPAHDASGIRAHTGAPARTAADRLGAHGYTMGEDIVFNGTPSLRMVAHEVVHVLQQRTVGGLKPGLGPVDDQYEREADAIAERIVAEQPVTDLLPMPAQAQGDSRTSMPIQRKSKEPDELWSERVASLIGKWVKTTSVAPTLDPGQKDAQGVWGKKKETIPVGTSVFVAGAVRSDGALQVSWPQYSKNGIDYNFRTAWIDHFRVELTAEPTQLQELKQGRQLTAQQDEQEKREQSQREHGIQDLGTIAKFDDGFYQRAGTLFDLAAPRQGDKTKLQLNFNLPVFNGPVLSCKLMLALTASIERGDPGLKARFELAGGVVAECDAWIVEVFAQAQIFGYVEAQGDSGAEVLRLMSLAICERVRGAHKKYGPKVANMIWGNDFVAHTLEEMDGDGSDYVDSGLGGEFKAGISVQRNPAVLPGSRAEVGYRGSSGTKLTKQGHQLLAGASDAQRISGKFSTKGWDLAGSYEWGTEGTKADIAGTRKTRLTELGISDPKNIELLLTSWVLGVVGTFSEVIGTAITDQHEKQTLLSVLSSVRDISFGPNLAEMGAKAAVLRKFGELAKAEYNQQLSIKLAFGKGKPPTIEVSFDTVNNIKYGENERSPFYLSLEEISRVLRVKKTIPLGNA